MIRRPATLDITLTVVLGAIFLISSWNAADARDLDALGIALVAANTLPLLALRRHPLAVVFALGVAYPVWAALEYPTHLLQSLPMLAGLVATGAAPKPLWWRALALVQPAQMMAFVLLGVWPVDVLEIGYVAIVFVVVWGLGVAIAARRTYARALEEKTEALEAARDELARAAVYEERTRIARDLHDIVAHAISVITVQAGVGAHLIENDPQQAARALRVIERTGRSALEDMRRLLDALRSDHLPTQPQPGLASLDALTEQITSAGVTVEMRVEGPTRPLPAGLELSAFRIAQEALTNTVKHAPGARAVLTLRYRSDKIELEVVDTGGRPDPSPNERGLGLKGMRERAALYGGSLEVGPCDGGFRVAATFPVDAP
jgi:signal transduction histidine kinase